MPPPIPEPVDLLLAECLSGPPDPFLGAVEGALAALLDAPELCLLFGARYGHRSCSCQLRLVEALASIQRFSDESGRLRLGADAGVDPDQLLAERVIARAYLYLDGGSL